MLPAANHLALEELGWASFQDLAIAYAEDLFGAPVISYAKTWDGGVDGELASFTFQDAKSPWQWAIQAKHTTRQQSLTESSLAEDFTKLPALVAEGFDAYLLVTNHGVSRVALKAVRERVLAAGFKSCHVHGREQLVRRIRRSANLRVLAPRVYGIGDLSLILDGRRAEQTQALLEASRADLDRFVATDPYRAAVRALTTDGVVVLLGEPAAGKSTIARALSVASVDAFKAEPYELSGLDQLDGHWLPREPRLFWIDDVFGPSQADYFAADTFNRKLPALVAALAKGSRFVLTSRTYIWRAVQPRLKLSTAPSLSKGIVEVKVEDFSPRDRALILANHVRLGDHSRTWKSGFKPLAPAVSRHPRFNPEVARRLGLEAITGQLELTARALERYVDNPDEYLEEVIGGLAAAGQAALALLFMHGGELPVTLPRDEALAVVLDAFPVSAPQIGAELDAMEGAFCVRRVEDGEPVWRFRHPTIGEAFASFTTRSSVLLDVYLRGAPPERILEEVVCAGVEVKGAKIEVGVGHFDRLIARMKAHYWGRLTRLPRWFLIVKATPEFRRRYFTTPLAINHPVLDDGRLLDHQTLALAAVLLPEGLVSLEYLQHLRGRIAKGLGQWGLRSCLSTWAREVLGAERFDELLQDVLAELRESGSSYMAYYEPSRDFEGSPAEAFAELIAFVEELAGWVDEDEADEVLEIVKRRVADRVAELEAEAEQEDAWRQEEEYYYASQQGGGREAPSENRASPFSFSTTVDPLADVFSDLDD
ncbi:hypothetical protein [Caulobacter sp.]|uniref:nSTAND3 domain-containing NTPase n=1 Tax=Caulobacter sp. TaxID=78 RepID=UPI001610F90D